MEDSLAILTSAVKLTAFVRRNSHRRLIAALTFQGDHLGTVGGTLHSIAIAIGDYTTFDAAPGEEYAHDDARGLIGEAAECVAVIDVSRMGPHLFQLNGLSELFTSDNILKVVFDARLSSVALADKFGINARPSPIFDTQLADVLFRNESPDAQLQRLRKCFHYEIFEASGLSTSLKHCVRLNSFTESLIEHQVPAFLERVNSDDDQKRSYGEGLMNTAPKDENAKTIKNHDDTLSIVQSNNSLIDDANQALFLFGLYKRLEEKYRHGKSLAWGELEIWSKQYRNYHTELVKRDELQEVPRTDKGADDKHNSRNARFTGKTKEGLDIVFYNSHSILPLGILPRRAMRGDGSEIQVGRMLTVDQQQKQCKGCRKIIGPLCDCFETGNKYCYVCHALNRSFFLRNEHRNREKNHHPTAILPTADIPISVLTGKKKSKDRRLELIKSNGARKAPTQSKCYSQGQKNGSTYKTKKERSRKMKKLEVPPARILGKKRMR